MNLKSSFILAASALIFSNTIGLFITASSWEVPHGHTGKLSPFKPTDTLIAHLDDSALKTLQSGKPFKTKNSINPQRALVVHDVNAPADIVMSQILDYNNYSKMAPQTLESEIYERTKNGSIEKLHVRLKTGMHRFAMEFFVAVTHHPKLNSITWTLDYTKQSDIEDACGHWYVEPHPSSPKEKSRLYYSVDMAIGPNFPSVVADFINRKAATDATTWVKKFSEKLVM